MGHDLEHNVWEVLNYNRRMGPGARCFSSSSQIGDNLIIHGGCPRLELRFFFFTRVWKFKCSIAAKHRVWTYKRETRTWTQLSSVPPQYPLHYLSQLFEWEGIILEIGGASPGISADDKLNLWTGFTLYKPGCPPGTSSLDFASLGCLPCNVGFYSSSSGPQCNQCPEGLTTRSNGSTTKANCSICYQSVCGHGQCSVTLPGPESACVCDFGFTKNDKGRCSVATYYLAGSGFLAGILLLLLSIAVFVRHKRVERNSRAALRPRTGRTEERMGRGFRRTNAGKP